MKKNPEVRRTWLRLAIKAILVIVVLWLCFGVFVGFRRISDISMHGRINDGDFVLFNRISGDYSVGDVILYTKDGQEYLSEIIAVANDLVTVNSEGYLVVNGEVASASAVYDYTVGETNPFGTGFRVPTNSFFVLNSNYEDLDDSRSFGAIGKNSIRGNIIALLLRTRSF